MPDDDQEADKPGIDPPQQQTLPAALPGTPEPDAAPDIDQPPPESAAVDLSGLTKSSARDVGLTTTLATPATGTGAGQTLSGVSSATLADTQRLIAIILLGTLIGIIAIELAFGAFFGISCWVAGAVKCQTDSPPAIALLTTTIQPVFTAVVGLVGSVVGFYFGSQKNG